MPAVSPPGAGSPAENSRDPRAPPGPGDLARIRSLVRSGTRDVKLFRRELWRLSRSTDPEALAILKEAMASPVPQHRAMAAMVLGAGSFPEAAELLRGLLQDPAPEVVCAAVRALGEVDLAALRQWGLPAIDAGGLAKAVQAEILTTLARHGDEVAIERVMAIAVEAADAGLVSCLLERMEGLSADVAVPVLQAIVAAPQGTPELRAMAYDALSDVDAPEAAQLLLQYATQPGAGAAERRQAAEALASVPQVVLSAQELGAAVAAEPDPVTRVSLYDAMRSLTAPDPAVLLPVLRAEEEPRARVAALLTAGSMVGMGKADPAMQAWFDTEGVPRLEESALSRALERESRMRALGALRNAGTPAAQAALARLAQSDDPVVRNLAARGVPARPRR